MAMKFWIFQMAEYRSLAGGKPIYSWVRLWWVGLSFCIPHLHTIYLYDFLEHPIMWRFRTPFCTPTHCSQTGGLIWQVKRPDRHLHVSFCFVASWCSLRKNRRGFTIHLVVLLFLHGSRSLHCRWTQQHAFWWVHMCSIQTTKHPPKVCLHQEIWFFIFRTGRSVLKISTYNMFYQCFTNWSSVVGLGELVVLGCAWFGSLLNSP